MSTPAPALIALRVVGTVAVAVAVLFGAVNVATSFASGTADESFSATGVRTLHVDVTAGRVDVERAAGSTVDVDVRARGSWRTPTTRHEQDGASLSLSADCGPTVGFHRCEVSYRVRVPDGVDVELRSAAGRIQVHGIDGDVTASVNAGRVELTELRSSSVDVTSDVGAVTATFADAPDAVRVTTSAGAVSITLPRDGEPYAVDARAEAGGASIDVLTDPTSPRTVVARTSVGSVEVGGR